MQKLRSYHRLAHRVWPKANEIRDCDRETLQSIRQRAERITELTDAELMGKAQTLKQRVQQNELDPVMRETVVEAFALTAEALRRTTGKVYYDCQLLAGLVLATGAIAQMQTGEGKTITCGLPAVLYGMTGKGVHVATTNAYLAERDHEELVPIFQLLGLSSGLIQSSQNTGQKKAAYSSDVTYGTGYEFGFDFLRDQLTLRNRSTLPLGTRFLSRMRGMKNREATLVQRNLAFAIIDEADSVLIDEATTPLILSGNSVSARPSERVYRHARDLALSLNVDVDFKIDPVKQSVKLTECGWGLVHERLTADVQRELLRPWPQYVEQALQAHYLLRRDVDYVVAENQVVLVDQNTGRLHEERKWRSGLHQAIETKESVTLTEEREIEARITRQRYFGFYEKVAGMTGTAEGNEAELLEFYRLPVVKIERNKPSKRVNLPSRYFGTSDDKYAAIAKDVMDKATAGQPVLVGTRTITQSRELSMRLNELGQPHAVLNGTQDQEEAEVIAKAGRSSVVTIATNMAGRGTDIRLDSQAVAAGGLHVAVVEHHESSRVDRQLIGRSARQSDPGSCQFFISAEDEIVRRYDPKLGEAIRKRVGPRGECDCGFDRQLEELQKRVERISFLARKKMVIHDKWIESVQKSVAKVG